ncbi:unnamed protein product [Trichobilharzia regenti]|nr:unnamed protein product [Trichobilharzia regenti]
MHGRVKVIQTAEQERARLLKMQQISKQFHDGCEKLWACRENGDYNEIHLREIATLVETSADTTTLWNYRREILMHLMVKYSDDTEKVSKLMEAELDLTTRCLYNSPKSYAVWHHRSWVMNNHTAPNWESEVKFCNMALKLDERNFHCWDYRRFVVSKGGIPIELEREFTDAAIERNMRCCRPLLDFSVPSEELDLVHNAIYTDPADQSPWFYYWWLLGRGERKVYLRELYISRQMERFVLVFSSPKLIRALKKLQVSIKVFPYGGTISDAVTLTPELLGGWNSVLDDLSAVWWLPISQDLVFRYAPESDKHLYQSRPWNVVAQGFKEEVNESLNKLVSVDPQRSFYYEHLRSFYAALDVLANVYENQSREVVLHNVDMSCFHSLDWYTLMTRIDFSNNSILRIPDTFAYLICLLELNLDDNQLMSLDGISRLPSLSSLSVQRNRLYDFKSIEDLFNCPRLRIVYISGNEVVKLSNLTELLSQHPGFQRQGYSFSLVYDKTVHS